MLRELRNGLFDDREVGYARKKDRFLNKKGRDLARYRRLTAMWASSDTARGILPDVRYLYPICSVV